MGRRLQGICKNCPGISHFWLARCETVGMANPLPALSLLETRVLGTLVEKQHTVPDTYPLTLNALVSGCNQKTSRSPVMEVSDTEAQAALDSLKGANLGMETSGGEGQKARDHAGQAR